MLLIPSSLVTSPNNTKDEQQQQIGSDVLEFGRRLIRSKHCNVAHVPWCAIHCAGNECVISSRYDDDGEPESAGVGQALLHELKQFYLADANNDCGRDEDPTTTQKLLQPHQLLPCLSLLCATLARVILG